MTCKMIYHIQYDTRRFNNETLDHFLLRVAKKAYHRNRSVAFHNQEIVLRLRALYGLPVWDEEEAPLRVRQLSYQRIDVDGDYFTIKYTPNNVDWLVITYRDYNKYSWEAKMEV